MEFYVQTVVTFLTLALVGITITHAASPPELYWKSMLPSTPMPKAISDLLHPADSMEDKSTSVKIGEGGVNVEAGNGNPVHVSVSPFLYNYAASHTQLHNGPNTALFFLEKDLREGTELGLRFTKASKKAQFLPRQVAQSIPFSSDKVEDIAKRFGVKSEMVKNTIKECEERGMRGEQKYCATSLESMLDFTTSKLGKNVRAVCTEVENEGKRKRQMQNYRIAPGGVRLNKNEEGIVVCHKQKYPYAVFYCHYTERIRGYSVRMEGRDGERVKAVAICHTDTSEWNPKHLAFQVLKVKAGSVPVCHFLPADHIVWVPNF